MTITDTPTHPDAASIAVGPNAVAGWIDRATNAAAHQLRWTYNLHYRRHHRTGPLGRYGDQFADQIACANVRYQLPITLARHLPGIALVDWVDPHPTVIDSTWTLHGRTIDVYWDYHPTWTIGDPTALTVQPTPAGPESEAA